MDKDDSRRDRYMKLLRVSVAYAEPDIIIWGPGRNKPQEYQKRERVREAIQRAAPNGKVVFPEDPEVEIATEQTLHSENVEEKELLQAMGADIIIALDLSPAVGEEVARYSAYPRIATKLFVIAPEERKSGYQEAIRNKVRVVFLKTEEMLHCDKTTQLCVVHVHTWCVRKYAEM